MQGKPISLSGLLEHPYNFFCCCYPNIAIIAQAYNWQVELAKWPTAKTAHWAARKLIKAQATKTWANFSYSIAVGLAVK